MELEERVKQLISGLPPRTSRIVDRSDAETTLKNKCHDVKVLWDKCVVVKCNTRVHVVCLRHNTVELYIRSDIIKGKYCCDECTLDKWKLLCADKNYTFIERVGKKSVVVSCNLCQTHQNVSPSRVLGSNGIDCEVCRINLFTTNCDKAGFNYTKHKRTSKGIEVHMLCNVCTSSKVTSSSSITRLAITCRVCQINRYKALLLSRGCLYVSHYAIKALNTTKVVYKNKLGDTREVSSSSLISGGFSDTANSAYTSPHSVYVMTNLYNGTMYVKIGTAGNPAKRLKTLKLVGEPTVRTLYSFDNRLQAIKCESYLHKVFHSYKVSSDIASEFSNNKRLRKSRTGECYIKSDGATEWFYPDVLNFIDVVNKDGIWQ